MSKVTAKRYLLIDKIYKTSLHIYVNDFTFFSYSDIYVTFAPIELLVIPFLFLTGLTMVEP